MKDRLLQVEAFIGHIARSTMARRRSIRICVIRRRIRILTLIRRIITNTRPTEGKRFIYRALPCVSPSTTRNRLTREIARISTPCVRVLNSISRGPIAKFDLSVKSMF